MSVEARSVGRVHLPHPWRELRRLSHVLFHTAEMEPGQWGATDGERRIWISNDLLQVERRCTLAHELEHLRRGHRGCQPGPVEADVAHAAAVWLLPEAGHVADAIVWARGDLDEAADHLWVDRETLDARLDPARMTRSDGEQIARWVSDEMDPA